MPPATIDGFVTLTHNAALALIHAHYAPNYSAPIGAWYLADTDDVDEIAVRLDRAIRMLSPDCTVYLFVDSQDAPVGLIHCVAPAPQQLDLL